LLRVSAQDTIWINQYMHYTSKEKAFFYRLVSKDSTGFKVEDHYINGVIQMTGFILSKDPFIKAGDFRYYDEKGILASQGKYANNFKTGIWNYYYPDGQLHHTCNYTDNGKIDGNTFYYYTDGKLKRSENYSVGVLLSGKCFTKSGADTTYFAFEEIPEFKGGEQKMNKFLTDNLRYPQTAWERRIQGTVYVGFVVDVKGRVKEVKIVKGVDIILNSAAVDVVTLMPKWKPGRIDGKPVRIQMVLPISFKLK